MASLRGRTFQLLLLLVCVSTALAYIVPLKATTENYVQHLSSEKEKACQTREEAVTGGANWQLECEGAFELSILALEGAEPVVGIVYMVMEQQFPLAVPGIDALKKFYENHKLQKNDFTSAVACSDPDNDGKYAYTDSVVVSVDAAKGDILIHPMLRLSVQRGRCESWSNQTVGAAKLQEKSNFEILLPFTHEVVVGTISKDPPHSYWKLVLEERRVDEKTKHVEEVFSLSAVGGSMESVAGTLCHAQLHSIAMSNHWSQRFYVPAHQTAPLREVQMDLVKVIRVTDVVELSTGAGPVALETLKHTKASVKARVKWEDSKARLFMSFHKNSEACDTRPVYQMAVFTQATSTRL